MRCKLLLMLPGQIRNPTVESQGLNQHVGYCQPELVTKIEVVSCIKGKVGSRERKIFCWYRKTSQRWRLECCADTAGPCSFKILRMHLLFLTFPRAAVNCPGSFPLHGVICGQPWIASAPVFVLTLCEMTIVLEF